VGTIRHYKLKMEWVQRHDTLKMELVQRYDKLKMEWVQLNMKSLKWSGYKT